MTWALDLDGVVWLAGRAIPGAPEAVGVLRAAGQRVVFLTNNSGPVVAEHLKALSRLGIECPPADLTTSAQAAASLLTAGSRAAVVGAGGIREALADRGVTLVAPGQEPEAVVVGRTVELDYWALAAAASAVRHGARFIATNNDPTFPTGSSDGRRGPEGAGDGSAGADGRAGGDGGDGVDGGDGLVPGAGALVAFIATASGRRPDVAGKPEEAMAELVRSRYGHLDVVAGDRPDTDGRFAVRVGARFGLVLSGVTSSSDLPIKPAPDLVAADLLSLVREYLGHRRG